MVNYLLLTTFHKVWLRNENFRMVKWNVRNTQVEYSARAQYKEKAEQQISVATGELEWKITTCKSVFHYSLTTLICFLTVVVICSFVFLVILLKIVLIRELYLINNDAVVSDVIGIICSAFFQIAFIKIFAIFYKFLAEKLSEIENPKTQRAYDDSVVYKRYFLGFVNNYIPIIYTAFIKNNFYDFPPKKVGYWNSNKLDYRKWDEDICSPRTCMLALLVQISSLMLWRCIIGNFSQVSRLWFYKISGLGSDSQLPSWENEYKLKKWDTLDGEYMELFIQCGYVVFFIIGFPFAPVMALINNIIQVRGDAMKMIKYYRRPVPKQNSSIGAWGKILAMMPYGAILTNSLIIAFTTDFVPRLLFQASSDSSLNYFIDYFFGDYHITHHSVFYNQTDKKRCITRFIELERPSKSEKELLEIDTLTMNIRLGRFAVIMLFEHVAVMFSAMVAYCIPDVTTIIKEFVYLERYEAKQIQLSLLRSDIIKRRSESHQNLRDNVSSVFDMEAFKKEREVELNKLKRN